MKMDIKAWSKSPDGIAMVDSQKVFCIGSQLWQGFKGCAIRAHEDQLDTPELQELARERDVDGSMTAVWFRRRQRLESRYMRKSREYDDRSATLRRERNEIRQSVREDKADGMPPSPADLRSVRRIDVRMERLNLLHEEEEARLALLHEKAGPNPPPELLTDERELTVEQADLSNLEIVDAGDKEEAAKYDPQTCPWPGCGKAVPPGRHPGKWLRSHKLGAHVGPAKRAAAKLEAAQGASA